MKNKPRFRFLWLTIAAAVCAVMLAVGVYFLQDILSVTRWSIDMRSRLDDINASVAIGQQNYKQTVQEFDRINRAKVRTMLLQINLIDKTLQSLQMGGDSELDTTERMKGEVGEELLLSLAKNFDVDQVMLLDREGNVAASAGAARYDFTDPRFSALRNVFADDGKDAFVKIDEGINERYRYYAEKLTDELEIVLEQDLSPLAAMIHSSISWEALLSPYEEDTNSLRIVFSDDAHEIEYISDDTLSGMTAAELGFTAENLFDGNTAISEVAGRGYFIGVSHNKNMRCYIVCANDEKALRRSEWFTAGMVLLASVAVLVLFSFSGAEQLTALSKRHAKAQSKAERKTLSRKLMALGALSLIAVFGISFYMQTLAAYSRTSYENNRQIDTLSASLNNNVQNARSLTKWYEDNIRISATMASDIVDAYAVSSDATYDNLTKLSEIVGAEEIMIFDAKGNPLGFGGDITGVSLDSTGYNKFSKLAALKDASPYVNFVINDESGSWEYAGIGKSTYKASENITVLRFDHSRLTALLSSTSMQLPLDNVHSTTDSFAIAVSKDSGEFAYSPNEKLIGKPAAAHGLTENQMREGYCDTITIDGESYYARCMETDAYYFFVASPLSVNSTLRLVFSVTVTLLTGVCILILLLIIRRIHKKLVLSNLPEGDGEPDKGSASPTRFARLIDRSMIRFGLSPAVAGSSGSRTATAAKWLLSVYVFIIACAVALRERLFGPYSIIRYVMDGGWEKGLNLFSMTAALFTLCGVATIAAIAIWVIRIAEPLISQRGRTIGRLTANAVKYASVILSVYYCLSLFGVDTTTLLASAGVLTGVIGLGSKEIIADIMSGLFLIFEGGFQVGDMVQIGSCKGVVTDIGIRVTKVRSSDGSLSIIPNGSVAGVINLSRFDTSVVMDFYVDYSERFERVEEVMNKELPKLAEKYPQIKSGPKYLGVTNMLVLRYTVSVLVKCAITDAPGLKHALTPEIFNFLNRDGIRMDYRQNTLVSGEKAPE